MKHLKLYEHISNIIHSLDIQGWDIDDDGRISWISEHWLFKTKKDLENFAINYMNDYYNNMILSDEISDNEKKDFKDILLDSLEECREFFISFNEYYGQDYTDDEFHFYVNSSEVQSNIEIRDDIKVKIDAKKYNL